MIKENGKSARLLVCRGLAAAALGCVALNAAAQNAEIPFESPRNQIEYKQSGNTYTWSPVTGETPKSAQPYRPDLSSGTVSNAEPKFKFTPQLPYEHKGGPNAKLTVSMPVEKSKLVSAASKGVAAFASCGLRPGHPLALAGSALACASGGYGLYELADALASLGIESLSQDESGNISTSKINPDATLSDGFSYYFVSKPGALYPSIRDAMLSISPGLNLECSWDYSRNQGFCTDPNGLPGNQYGGVYRTTSSCSAGNYYFNGTCYSEAPLAYVPIEQALHQKLYDEPWSTAHASMTAAVLKRGDNVFTDGTDFTLNGPAAVPAGQSVTTTPVNVLPGTTTPAPVGHTGPTDSGIQTTTKTDTWENTYTDGSPGNMPKIETTAKSVTTTTITNNVTNTSNSSVSSTTVTNEAPPEEKEDDFCKKNPDSIACAELDEPEQELPESTVNIEYGYTDLFGNGSCPADAYLSKYDLKVWDWQQACNAIEDYLRPILIACCAFSAFVIVAGGSKE